MKLRDYLLERGTNLDQTLQDLAKALKEKNLKDIESLSAAARAFGMRSHDLAQFIKHRGGKPVRHDPRWTKMGA